MCEDAFWLARDLLLTHVFETDKLVYMELWMERESRCDSDYANVVDGSYSNCDSISATTVEPSFVV